MIGYLFRCHLFNSQCMSLFGCELININKKKEIDNLCVLIGKNVEDVS